MNKYLLILWVFTAILCTPFSSHAQTDTMEHGRGQMEGRVTYGDTYLPFARIMAYKGNRRIKGTRADSNGVFTFASLPGGMYKLKVVTSNNDILVSKGVLVTEQEDNIATCDEFFLVDKKKTKRRRAYPDTAIHSSIDSICVFKAKREMKVYFQKRLLKTYHISLGFTPIGAKQCQGDGKTPEGLYTISDRNPYSAYHKSLGISYPNAADAAYARKAGKPAGGDVKIHGLPNGEEANKDDYLEDDWTWGCIAVSNEEVDELYKWVDKQAVILILP